MTTDDLNVPPPRPEPVTLTIEGRAVPKGSLTTYGPGRTTAPDSVKQWQRECEYQLLPQIKSNRHMFPIKHPTPVEMILVFYFARPKTHRHANGRLNKTGREYPRPSKGHRGDADKLERAILDALQNVQAYDDDVQVNDTVRRIFWDDHAHVLIQIRPTEDA